MTTPATYTVRQLPGQCWTITDSNGKSWGVYDRSADAERVAYCMTITAESEQTAKRDEAVA